MLSLLWLYHRCGNAALSEVTDTWWKTKKSSKYTNSYKNITLFLLQNWMITLSCQKLVGSTPALMYLFLFFSQKNGLPRCSRLISHNVYVVQDVKKKLVLENRVWLFTVSSCNSNTTTMIIITLTTVLRFECVHLPTVKTIVPIF